MSTLVTLILSLVMDFFSSIGLQSAEVQPDDTVSSCIEIIEGADAAPLSENEKNNDTFIVG